MVNIFDIAKKAGVSKSTVSRVASGHGYVSDQTREKILAAMKELHYSPNQLARNMKYQKTHNIGFLVPGYYPAVGDFINYFAKIARNYYYRINIYFTETKEDEINILNQMRTHELDGVFILEKRNTWETIKSYTHFGPIATWRRIDDKSIYSAYIDHYPIYLEILEYIRQLGVKRIGHILNNEANVNTKARLQAIKDFQNNYPGIDHSWKMFFQKLDSVGINSATAWVESTNRPEVVIAFSDYIAAEFISSLSKLGYRVPEDCKVFGFDNSDYSRIMDISTVDPAIELQAENSFYYIYNQLHGNQFLYHKIKPEMIIRSSC
jgi:DNA-binding LacI/PurR family transcriptional regulator